MSNIKTWLILSTLCFFTTINSWASKRVQDIKELDRPKKTKVARVRTARVLLADYEMLKRDFPNLREKSTKFIDNWLLATAGKVAITQASQEVTNEKIETEQYSTDNAYRPHFYGRALVFKSEDDQLLDVKGVGAKNPGPGDHSTGTLSLGKAIREYVVQRLVQKVFDHATKLSGGELPFSLSTVKNYAVLDLGFNTKDDYTMGEEVLFENVRAGALVRQAHQRVTPQDGNHFLPIKQGLLIETLLRYYGITSCGGFSPIIDIQGTPTNSVVDFETYLVLSDYKAFSEDEAIHMLDKDENSPINLDDCRPIHHRINPMKWGCSLHAKLSSTYGIKFSEIHNHDNMRFYAEKFAHKLKKMGNISKERYQELRDMLVYMIETMLFSPEIGDFHPSILPPSPTSSSNHDND